LYFYAIFVDDDYFINYFIIILNYARVVEKRRFYFSVYSYLGLSANVFCWFVNSWKWFPLIPVKIGNGDGR